MNSLRVAVIFDQYIHSGGSYQQQLNDALLVRQIPSNLAEPVYFTTIRENTSTLESFGISANLLLLSKAAYVFLKLRHCISHPSFLKAISRLFGSNTFEKQLINHNIDLVYFLSAANLASHLEQLNYMTTVLDLCHRDDLEFPEVRCYREFEKREKYYRTILTKSVAILTDSQLGKANILNRYGVDNYRVHVMPFQPAQFTQISNHEYASGYIDIQHKYNLSVPYIFYPAQFWAHKNHVYILEGLKALESKYGIEIGAIFSGTDKGNQTYVESRVSAFGLDDRIRFPGFVPNNDMPYLYRQSLALVMPTYFGPTNLPPLEAFSLGVPVLYSDKTGLREQVDNAALLVDLNDPCSMADMLHKIITDQELRSRLCQNGHQQMNDNIHASRVEALTSILTDFRRRRSCWK